MSGQKRRQRTVFALHGVEHHAVGFEQYRTEQSFVLLFTENDWSGALGAIEAEEHIADLPVISEASAQVKVHLECGRTPSLRSKAEGIAEYTVPESTRKLSSSARFGSCGVGNVQLDMR